MGSHKQSVPVLLEHMQNVTYLHVRMVRKQVASLELWLQIWTVLDADIRAPYNNGHGSRVYLEIAKFDCGESAICLREIWVYFNRGVASELGILGNSLTFELQKILDVHGCLVTSAKVASEEGIWGLILVYNTIMMLFMLPPAYKAFKRGGRSTMTNIVIKEVSTIAKTLGIPDDRPEDEQFLRW
ncbi:hypothetical protein BDQ17DRAFT_1330389 [Cyathus striatus]|nr:hypothetical protein BDQ17DRAFT_1330389 [Cyathus striatus]